MEFHEIANIFPMMTGNDFKELKDDIAANGLREPIYIYEGKILDGRNRYIACMDLGIEPKYKEFDGDNPVAFVVSMNIRRRHLTSSQLAVCALEILPMLEAEAKKRQGKRNDLTSVNDLTEVQRSADQVSKIFDTNRQYVSVAKKLAETEPDLLEEVKQGKLTIPEAKKEANIRNREIERQLTAEKGKAVPENKRWNVWQADIRTWKAPRQYDFIITDPPYPKEYLELYSILAKRSLEWLKPGGLLIVMCGLFYISEIYNRLNEYLEYHWTAVYLMPGLLKPIRLMNVNSSWKPLLIYSKDKYKGKMFSDVFTSPHRDKKYHVWGQSEEGMYSIISGICLPGQYILDPFCGAGSTGIAALKNGCLFDGIDIDIKSVNITKGRLNEATKTL